MKRRAHAKRRDANEPEIVSALRSVGCLVYLLDSPVDLLVGFRRATWLLEVKDGSKPASARPLTPMEAAFLNHWRGGRAGVVRCAQEAMCVMGIRGCANAPVCGCGAVDDPAWFVAARAVEVEARAVARRAMRARKVTSEKTS